MAKANEAPVSFWVWFLIIFLLAFPCVNVITIFVLAFVGSNQTRKNFFRALLAWAFLFTGFYLVLFALGLMPVIFKLIEHSVDYWPPFLKGE